MIRLYWSGLNGPCVLVDHKSLVFLMGEEAGGFLWTPHREYALQFLSLAGLIDFVRDHRHQLPVELSIQAP